MGTHARKPIPVSPYDQWLKELRDVHSEAAANVDRIDREIAVKTAELDALFAERAEQAALRDHTATTIHLDPTEYRTKASKSQWQITQKKTDEEKETR